jgi:hypothetical protein
MSLKDRLMGIFRRGETTGDAVPPEESGRMAVVEYADGRTDILPEDEAEK